MSNIIYSFEYNGVNLSDFNSIVCSFNGTSSIVTTQGSMINYQTFKNNSTQRFTRTGITYDTPLSLTFQFCKVDCLNEVNKIYTQEEIRAILRWLNEENYKTLKLISDTFNNIYFKAYANVNKINYANQCIGFEITFTMDSNFGYFDKHYHENITDNKKNVRFMIDNDRETFIHPTFKLKVLQAGNLELYSNTEPNRKLTLKNCSVGEIIVIDCERRTIESSDVTHNLPHSFNFVFPRYNYTFDAKYYFINCNLNCEIDIYITETRKIGV